MGLDASRLIKAASGFPLPPGIHFSYGTAGFRADGSILDCVVFRAGIVAALRSLNTGSTIGLMITASHNPIQDNGVKIADPNGDMLSQEWEPFAESLANESNLENVVQVVEDFMQKNGVFKVSASSGKVLLARDTRPSGGRLLDAAKQGVEAIAGVSAEVIGVLTTPQLHWMVRATNRGVGASEHDYYSQISSGFKCIVDMIPMRKNLASPSELVIVDGANGVGAMKLSGLQAIIPNVQLNVRNCGSEGGILNELVGADYVQKERKFPQNFGHASDLTKIQKSEDAEGITLRLLDGDKILTLLAIFIQKHLQELRSEVHWLSSVNFGVVQTAYANGASTKFLKENLGVEVVLTPTGVKHLHHKAAQYDIGIYFEANGHGTVLFKEEFFAVLTKTAPSEFRTEAAYKAARLLLAISDVVNQAIGDAFSVLFLVESALQYMNWTIQDWDAIYKDLPSRQLKVQDRAVLRTTNSETKVTHPQGLQSAIDMEVAKVTCGRAFVRPSGTEDVVRVYAEAATQDEADCLARGVAIHVHNLAQGVGLPP
ncbi:hypothetical protein KP509_04G012400 [Ceratopteris richardii]|uniref:Phosphoacetylglucosamine mutase n=1 Tax=Ceratopteris richardii TaxID=49495 RepID=A0A8T2UQB1_CERRI|nr:hypothetical protein KP509_04G012400 [Ceratopteris richardii]